MQRKFLQKALDYYQRFAGETSTDPKVRLKTAQAYRSGGEYPGEPRSALEAEAAYRRAMTILEKLVAGRTAYARIPERTGENPNAIWVDLLSEHGPACGGRASAPQCHRAGGEAGG